MSQSEDERGDQFYAETYDESVPDWPNEIDFYQEMAAGAKQAGRSVLELACGTGRVAIRLAGHGARVVGLDLSRDMLEVARRKSVGLANVRWVEGNMQSFQLDEVFGLVIITGDAFQHLNTPDDQLACLECIKRHLIPPGQLVLHINHLDIMWLGELLRQKEHPFELEGKFIRSATGHEIQSYRAWSYEPSTQTAIVHARWEEMDTNGHVTDSWQTAPARIHCAFRFEMEHVLARAGFVVDSLYGDFSRHPLADNSAEMIWVAHGGSTIP
ncbi:MAG TPA: class I SAM-dependent methyltransferase [Anaerolineales bacterium]|nr:class I SAM-dependent methyltransferase [Anaerolineales bacterium]